MQSDLIFIDTPPKKLVLSRKGSGGYIDYYDHWFDLDSNHEGIPIWFRNGRDFPSRTDGFKVFQKYGIPTPWWGKVKDAPKLDKVVVYTDETYHQGMYKELLSLDEALRLYPYFLCSEFVESKHPQGHGVSRRWLMIGSSGWELEYISSTDWRSNAGDVEIQVIGPLAQNRVDILIQIMQEFKTPLLAIDLVPELATDLNFAPGLHNSGMKDFVPAKEAANLIKEFFHAYSCA